MWLNLPPNQRQRLVGILSQMLEQHLNNGKPEVQNHEQEGAGTMDS
jgi:hypothetical protein